MKTIFRTTWKYWVAQDGAGLFIFLMGTGFFWWFRIYWLGVICLVMSVLTLRAILKSWQNRVEVDGREIVSTNDSGEVRIAWHTILAAQFIAGPGAAKTLQFWTAEQGISIPVQQFDYKSIWQLVERLAPPAALEETAVLRTPAHKLFAAGIAEKVAGIQGALRVKDHWFLKGTGWALSLICVPTAISLLVIQEPIIALTPLIFALLGVIITTNTGSLEIDREVLTRKTILGRYQMRWDEVRCIEHHEQDSAWLLCGDGKQLGIPAPQWCSTKERDLYSALLSSEIQKRGITMKRTWKVLFKWSKNTRVRA